MIKFEEVTRSYTGKRGCMCGCKGKYSRPEHFEVDPTKVERHSDRSVKIAVTKVNKAIDWDNPTSVAQHSQTGFDGGMIYFVETETTNTVVYCKAA